MPAPGRITPIIFIDQAENYRRNALKQDMYDLYRRCVRRIFNDKHLMPVETTPTLANLAANKILQSVHTPFTVSIEIDFLTGQHRDLWISVDYPRWMKSAADAPYLEADLFFIDHLPLPADVKRRLKAQRTFHRRLFDLWNLYVLMQYGLPYFKSMPAEKVFTYCLFFSDRLYFPTVGIHAFGDRTAFILFKFPPSVGDHVECNVDECPDCKHRGLVQCFRQGPGSLGFMNSLFVHRSEIQVETAPGIGPINGGLYPLIGIPDAAGADRDFKLMVRRFPYELLAEIGAFFGESPVFQRHFADKVRRRIEEMRLPAADDALAKFLFFAHKRRGIVNYAFINFENAAERAIFNF